jgi:hypothetical protein
MIFLMLILIAAVSLGHDRPQPHSDQSSTSSATVHKGSHTVIIKRKASDGRIVRETLSGEITKPSECNGNATAWSVPRKKRCSSGWDTQR